MYVCMYEYNSVPCIHVYMYTCIYICIYIEYQVNMYMYVYEYNSVPCQICRGCPWTWVTGPGTLLDQERASTSSST